MFYVHVTVHRDKFLIINQLDALNSEIYFGMKCFGQFLCPSSGVFHCTHITNFSLNPYNDISGPHLMQVCITHSRLEVRGRTYRSWHYVAIQEHMLHVLTDMLRQ